MSERGQDGTVVLRGVIEGQEGLKMRSAGIAQVARLSIRARSARLRLGGQGVILGPSSLYAKWILGSGEEAPGQAKGSSSERSGKGALGRPREPGRESQDHITGADNFYSKRRP